MTEIRMVRLKDIKIPEGFNPRENMGDMSDLKESFQEVGENISPVGLFEREDGKYELMYGERRLRTASDLKWKDIKAEIHTEGNEYSRALLVLHENLGRKDLEWTEEADAFNRITELRLREDDTTIGGIIKDEAKKTGKSSRTMQRIRERSVAIRRYPFLKKEPSAEQAMDKYYKIEKLPEKDKQILVEGKGDLEKLLKRQSKKSATKKKVEVEEIPEDPAMDLVDTKNDEIEKLKKKLSETLMELTQLKDSGGAVDVYKEIKEKDKQERMEEGIWLIDEVIKAVRCGRACPAFGLKDDPEIDCKKECHKYEDGINEMCDWWHENVLGKFEKIED